MNDEVRTEVDRANAIRERIAAQLDDEEIRTKIRMADAMIWVLDRWQILLAFIAAVLAFVFWMGVNVGRSLP
jgi:uncharacterized membrane protein